MRILLADHNVLFREGLIGLLSRDPEIEVVGVAGLAREAISITEELDPDILLLEMDLPDGSGLDVIKTLYSTRPEVRIVVLTMQITNDLLLAGVENGLKGYLLKDIPARQLIEFLRGVTRGEAAFQPATVWRLIDHMAKANHVTRHLADFDQLTNREVEVLDLLRQGASNIEIANSLNISENTAKAHVRKILEKLNLRNRREARNLANRYQLPARNRENGGLPLVDPPAGPEKKDRRARSRRAG